MRDQHRFANEFLTLHEPGDILVLPNAWDAASARICAAAGARAIGTTSMGISASLGFPDMQRLPFESMLEAVRRIVDSVDLPVTADLEAGYAETTAGIVQVVRRAVDTGIVGINIEDGTGNPDRPLIEPAVLAERIGAIREATASHGLHLVINGRTDVFLVPDGEFAEKLDQALDRLSRYRAAGADCVFAPGRLDCETIAALVDGVAAPLNVLANPALAGTGLPSVGVLHELGVARVSVGSGLMRSALAHIGRAAEELLGEGTYTAMEDELARPGAAATYGAAIGAVPDAAPD